ncbi:Uu.00g017220.m01.CDS01 [Anthostomella pinea]|uniref:Uu.00g017220.m01.CDS01 n=1 Tax=Anthostomella pinea TaxID=933095 RepID=A0AAI8W030_9PEZI|nr:Uu.00g017220.m01.CDS01 [Anthostomella pinea]
MGDVPASNSDPASDDNGISLVAFITALSTSLVVFGIQTGFFLLLRTKLARIFKPKTYLVPERERTDPPPDSPWGLFISVFRFRDREIIKKCGLDSYFFLRYLQTLLIIFIPMAAIIIPILVPLNYVDGRSHDFDAVNGTNTTNGNVATDDNGNRIAGLDTLAWGNVKHTNTRRYWAHLVLAIFVVIWVCGVFFAELRVYIKVRQDWLTTAEHRLRASATTVLVSEIPDKWLNEEALRGLFDVFPGGLRNIWLTRDLTHLLEKISKRDDIHKQLEGAQTELIRMAKKKQLEKREEDEKKARKASKTHPMTKDEKLDRKKQEDAAAKIQAEAGQGLSSGDRHEVPHDVDEAEDEVRHNEEHQGHVSENIVSAGLWKLKGGFGKGVDAVSKTGQGLFGGVQNVRHGIDDQIETTNGFVAIKPSAPTRDPDRRHIQLPDEEDLPRPSTQNSNRPKRSEADDRVMGAAATRPNHAHSGSVVSQDSMLKRESIEMRQFGNSTRKAANEEDMYDNEKPRWYQFWKPPVGGFASPLPQGYEGKEFPFKKKKTFLETLKSAIPFVGGEELEPVEYTKAYNEDFEEEEDKDGQAEWEKWIKRSDRPTHRLAKFGWTPGWLPGLPVLNKKVDTIYWCRTELARLNHEIEADQQNPERYPLMKSAFIQFNHQVAAHMACQSIIHHVPKQMAPRTVEISPNDVLWDNMAVSWWSEWLRTFIAIAIVTGMIILWAFPVAFTGSLSQLNSLIETFPWLGFLDKNPVVKKTATAVAGVLPAILLALLLFLVPLIMEFLAGFRGAKTGTQKSEMVQVFYFAFLFVQVFLVVSLASGALAALENVLKQPTGIADILAQKLPTAANYFFSYMILQALSVSSGTLLQIGSLVNWYVIARITNNTARSKWETNTNLPTVKWGTYFPVYTNFACIGLIYSVIAPIISIFAIITFSLLWVANRYAMIYVNRLTIDTGGVLYPRAINQTFTGLYVMELCLIGLFFLVRDENDEAACEPQAIIMIVVIILTILYQLLLNLSFAPLFRYLPITFEDEAVLRDEAFQRAQDRRLGLADDDDEVYDKEDMPSHHRRSGEVPSTSLDSTREKTRRGNKFTNFKPVKGIVHAGTWAARGTYDHTFGRAEQGIKSATKFREERRQKDLEAQRAIGDALYGGFHDEIEDLTPEERDILVKRAFMHSALRARRPTLWVPRDDLGISDDEIRRTRDFSEHIWISNEGTALDSKVRVVYGRAPPDFSELDIIQL